jgi:acetyl esterase/lipase
MTMPRLAWFGLLALLAPAQTEGVRIEPNILFGMYSGLALLMDVYHPSAPNGYGVVYISGSGWHAPQEYTAEPLKESGQSKLYAQRLAAAGYTVFAINHRAAPRFRYPAAVEDAQRAVRFVRHHAARFKVNPARIGAVGGSSGGHLVLMLGLMDGRGDPDASDPVERASAKVQCVVARAAPADMAKMAGGGQGAVVSFLGMALPGAPVGVQTRIYKEASPASHVTPDDPPVLLMHGDADTTVPFDQAELMESVLRKAGVATKLVRVPGGGHGPTFAGATNPPDYMAEMTGWLAARLPAPPPSSAAGRVLVDNEYCRIVMAANTPGQKSRRHKHDVNRIMIHLDPGRMRLAFDDGVINDVTFRAGSVRWDPAGGFHTSENTGGTYYRIVEVELKRPGMPVQFGDKDPVRVDPKRFAVEMDNPQVRVLRARYSARDSGPPHRHDLPRVVVTLTEQGIRFVMPDGSTREVRNPAGQTTFAPDAAEHSEVNLLDTPFEAVLVEFK